jgi:hypothetical protein
MILVLPAPIKITLSHFPGAPLDPLTTSDMPLLLLGFKLLVPSPITHCLLISWNPKAKIPNSKLSSILETSKAILSSPGPESNSLISLFLLKEFPLEFPTPTFGQPPNTLISQPVLLQEKLFSRIPCSPQPPALLTTSLEVKDAVSFMTQPIKGTNSVSDVMRPPPMMAKLPKTLQFTHTSWVSSMFLM